MCDDSAVSIFIDTTDEDAAEHTYTVPAAAAAAPVVAAPAPVANSVAQAQAPRQQQLSDAAAQGVPTVPRAAGNTAHSDMPDLPAVPLLASPQQTDCIGARGDTVWTPRRHHLAAEWDDSDVDAL